MKKILLICLGVLLVLAGLWVGAYVLGTLPDGHWARFPVSATSVFAVLGGYLLTAWSAIFLSSAK
jgi:hypothetical protein